MLLRVDLWHVVELHALNSLVIAVVEVRTEGVNIPLVLRRHKELVFLIFSDSCHLVDLAEQVSLGYRALAPVPGVDVVCRVVPSEQVKRNRLELQGSSSC